MLQLAIENSKPKNFTKAATTRTVRALKVDGSDFEFYPTSKEHVDIILKDMDVEAGQLVTVSSVDPNGNSIVLLKTRFYLNGNRHYQFEPNAMLRLNIAASRILGWVRSKQEFCDETGLGEQLNKDYWYCVDKMKFIESSLPLLRDITNE